MKGHIEDARQFIRSNVSQDDAKAILKTTMNVGTKLAGKEHLTDKINSGVERGVNYGYETGKKSLKDHAKELKDIYKPEIDEGVQFAKGKAQQKFDEKFGKKDEEQTGDEGFKK